MSVFNENDLIQFQEKLLVGFGSLFGFRGSSKHVNLTLSMIGNGNFTNDHPLFPGMEWWGIKHISKDKRHKLGLHMLHVKETEDDIGKFPVLSDGKKGDVRNDIGRAIKRFMSLLPESVKNNRFYKRVTKDNLFPPIKFSEKHYPQQVSIYI